MQDSIPEYDVQPEWDKAGVPTGRWIWTVFDPASGGPIKDGTSENKAMAHITGRAAREVAEVAQMMQQDKEV